VTGGTVLRVNWELFSSSGVAGVCWITLFGVVRSKRKWHPNSVIDNESLVERVHYG